MNSPRRLRRSRTTELDTTGVLLDLPTGKRLDLREVFIDAPDRPVEVEVGIGKGGFLLARARQRPGINLLGIEYARAYATYAADRARRAELSNVRVLCTEAAQLFTTCLDDCCLQRVHIYFPDPWPKRKHHHRRLIQPAFIQQVQRVLKLGGQLLIVTDYQEYFGQIQRVMNSTAGFLAIKFPQSTDRGDLLVETNFERKYAQEGRIFYRIAFIRYV
ncbi:MAG TPA: tRNA (guanosine(46)-N7)-methyltransferase TrmB [Phycisphaerae bacterium]|nr:tRNA (guanosine(46)-N7)-methyltransferase TrmB [Phycisphaerae bacterium]